MAVDHSSTRILSSGSTSNQQVVTGFDIPTLEVFDQLIRCALVEVSEPGFHAVHDGWNGWRVPHVLAPPTVTYTGAECATLLFEPTARAATQQPAAGLSRCSTSTRPGPLVAATTFREPPAQTLQLIEVEVDVGLRTQQ